MPLLTNYPIYSHKKINPLTPLPYSFNIKNTTELIQNLKETPILLYFTFASLDITNMYSNIPVTETKQLLADIREHNLIDTQINQELLNWYYVITKQNYLINNNGIIIPKDSRAMGAPSSSIIAEMFVQRTENSHLAHLTQKRKIIKYFRYVDDIFLIFDPNYMNIQAILNDFYAMHPKLHFTAEIEQNNTLNYLDISIHKTPTNIKSFIYRKPTFSDTIIPYTSNNHKQHTYTAIKFPYNRINTYQLHKEEYQQEENIIHNILYNNSFLIQPQKSPNLNPNKKFSPTHKHRWATFTYIGKETTYITNIFKHSDIRIAYRTNNTIQNHLMEYITLCLCNIQKQIVFYPSQKTAFVI
jgi:hypothetical protein